MPKRLPSQKEEDGVTAAINLSEGSSVPPVLICKPSEVLSNDGNFLQFFCNGEVFLESPKMIVYFNFVW